MHIIEKDTYKCPECGELHKLKNIKGETIIFIRCKCQVGAFLKVKDGYFVPPMSMREKKTL